MCLRSLENKRPKTDDGGRWKRTVPYGVDAAPICVQDSVEFKAALLADFWIRDRDCDRGRAQQDLRRRVAIALDAVQNNRGLVIPFTSRILEHLPSALVALSSRRGTPMPNCGKKVGLVYALANYGQVNTPFPVCLEPFSHEPSGAIFVKESRSRQPDRNEDRGQSSDTPLHVYAKLRDTPVFREDSRHEKIDQGSVAVADAGRFVLDASDRLRVRDSRAVEPGLAGFLPVGGSVGRASRAHLGAPQ